jgi:hypothetical protein
MRLQRLKQRIGRLERTCRPPELEPPEAVVLLEDWPFDEPSPVRRPCGSGDLLYIDDQRDCPPGTLKVYLFDPATI